jgi:ribonucleotide reductase alpha subunit
LPFTSPQSQELNRTIFQEIYYAFLKESNNLAIKRGRYPEFKESYASKGALQFDLWKKDRIEKASKNTAKLLDSCTFPSYINQEDEAKWDLLKNKIKEFGLRNCAGICIIPSEKLSSIFNVSVGVEPVENLVNRIYYDRNRVQQSIKLLNSSLAKDIEVVGVSQDQLFNFLLLSGGSMQSLYLSNRMVLDKEVDYDLFNDMKQRHKTRYELCQREIIKMAITRGPFICHSQIFKLYIQYLSVPKVTAIHFYMWDNLMKNSVFDIDTTARFPDRIYFIK